MQVSSELDWGDPEVCRPENLKYNFHTVGYSPGRRHESCGDWVWFNPRQKFTVTAGEAAHLHNTIPTIPSGHPQGYHSSEAYDFGDVPGVGCEPNNEGKEIMEEEIIPDPVSKSSGNELGACSSAVGSGESAGSSDVATRLILFDLLKSCGVRQEELAVPLSTLQERVKAILASASQASEGASQASASQAQESESRDKPSLAEGAEEPKEPST